MIKFLPFFIALLLLSCSAEQKLLRLKKKHPELFIEKTDTVTKKITIASQASNVNINVQSDTNAMNKALDTTFKGKINDSTLTEIKKVVNQVTQKHPTKKQSHTFTKNGIKTDITISDSGNINIHNETLERDTIIPVAVHKTTEFNIVQRISNWKSIAVLIGIILLLIWGIKK